MRNKKFKFATGDVNVCGGATYFRKLSAGRYHFIQLLNWEHTLGSEAPEGSKYNAQLSEVNLGHIAEEEIKKAISSCENESEADDEQWQALACYEYGLYAPLSDEDGNNLERLFKRAAAESTRIELDEAYAEKQLKRPVNKIGSTAEEFMRGDIDSAIARGAQAGNKSAAILAKMHGMSFTEK